MRTIFKLLLVVIFLASNIAYAEIKTYEGVGEYVMSDFETAEVAKERAKVYAERNAQEKAGIYLSSYSKTADLELTVDELETMAATILRVVDLKYETLSTGDGVKYRATIKVEIDSDEIPRWLARDKKERDELVAQNKALRKSFDEQEQSINSLKDRLTGVDNPNDKEKIQQEFEKADREFLSNQKIAEGNQFAERKDYANATKIYTEAIKLNPDNIFAYSQRGIAFYDSGDYVSAIPDLTKVIAFYPNDYTNYARRAVAYVYTGNTDGALKDFTKLIELQPNEPTWYYSRGLIYEALGQTEKAAADSAKFKALSNKK